MIIFSNESIRVEVEDAEIPWLTVFCQRGVKEFFQCSAEEKIEIFRVIDIIERQMDSYFSPDKINIASFGNMLPQVHWHVMARFAGDSYFPQPMWGEKQRESTLELPSSDVFYQDLGDLL
ncbi:MAG TPA: HIT family protein [Candidatus Thioglobus sp.]|jgi:diadenosine tetraphosphate (Ap4A) HIT family hydrolase|nr:HIT family protein [Candidatus Thioglobus sp.]HIL21034.1 HIT family protein [Candidatus Thioglobus sp.]